MTTRDELSKVKRLVVKVGSRSLARDPALPASLARQIADLGEDRSVVLVTSGAIALGVARLGYRTRPGEMARLQAAAASGQVELMRRWNEALEVVGRTAAQVLLTHSDLADRERLNNARNALAALLDAGAVPVVNENDTVATDEIRFGDNDQLAAMVAPMIGAELLVLLTDVDGVLDAAGNRVSVMTDAVVIGQPSASGERLGSGGMQSKLEAADKATRAGAAVVIAPALEPDVLGRILKGHDIGTLLPRTGEALRARKHWIAYTLKPRGTLILDAGAVHALLGGRSSLLPVGVLGLRGQFNPGDSVSLVAADGDEVGRGLTRLGALDVARAAGKKGNELELAFGPQAKDLVVVHKDDLVLGGVSKKRT